MSSKKPPTPPNQRDVTAEFITTKEKKEKKSALSFIVRSLSHLYLSVHLFIHPSHLSRLGQEHTTQSSGPNKPTITPTVS